MIPVAVGILIGSVIATWCLRRWLQLRLPIVLGSAACALGLGLEMVMLFAVVERRDLGIATTGIRFIETLGTSAGAAGYASVFGALVPIGATLATIGDAIDLVFLVAP